MDAFGLEQHFLDHLAPVWASLPSSERGRFFVAPDLAERARAKGIAPTVIEVDAIRRTPQQPPNLAGLPALIASIGDAKVARRMGYGPFAFLEHGAGQSYGQSNAASSSYAGGPDRQDHELVMVPNEYAAAKWRAAYPSTWVEVVGCPKLDTLPTKEPGPVTVAISFHWPASPLVSGYAGTAFGDFIGQLPELAQAFNVIGHQHPNWLGRKIAGPPSKTYERIGIPFVEDFEDVCRQADVYVCDNSSTTFEFAATGRPVVLLNSRHWSRKDPNPPGLRFWDAAHVGVNVSPGDNLVEAVALALADPPEQQVAREDALRFVYGLRTNGAAAAATAILDWLAGRKAAAA